MNKHKNRSGVFIVGLLISLLSIFIAPSSYGGVWMNMEVVIQDDGMTKKLVDKDNNTLDVNHYIDIVADQNILHDETIKPDPWMGIRIMIPWGEIPTNEVNTTSGERKYDFSTIVDALNAINIAGLKAVVTISDKYWLFSKSISGVNSDTQCSNLDSQYPNPFWASGKCYYFPDYQNGALPDFYEQQLGGGQWSSDDTEDTSAGIILREPRQLDSDPVYIPMQGDTWSIDDVYCVQNGILTNQNCNPSIYAARDLRFAVAGSHTNSTAARKYSAARWNENIQALWFNLWEQFSDYIYDVNTNDALKNHPALYAIVTPESSLAGINHQDDALDSIGYPSADEYAEFLIAQAIKLNEYLNGSNNILADNHNVQVLNSINWLSEGSSKKAKATYQSLIGKILNAGNQTSLSMQTINDITEIIIDSNPYSVPGILAQILASNSDDVVTFDEVNIDVGNVQFANAYSPYGWFAQDLRLDGIEYQRGYQNTVYPVMEAGFDIVQRVAMITGDTFKNSLYSTDPADPNNVLVNDKVSTNAVAKQILALTKNGTNKIGLAGHLFFNRPETYVSANELVQGKEFGATEPTEFKNGTLKVDMNPRFYTLIKDAQPDEYSFLPTAPLTMDKANVYQQGDSGQNLSNRIALEFTNDINLNNTSPDAFKLTFERDSKTYNYNISSVVPHPTVSKKDTIWLYLDDPNIYVPSLYSNDNIINGDVNLVLYYDSSIGAIKAEDGTKITSHSKVVNNGTVDIGPPVYDRIPPQNLGGGVVTNGIYIVTDDMGVLAVDVSINENGNYLNCTQVDNLTVHCPFEYDGIMYGWGDRIFQDIWGNSAGNLWIASGPVGPVEDIVPEITIIAPITSSNSEITNVQIKITDNLKIDIDDVTITGADSTCEQINAAYVHCTANVTTTGDMVVTAMDYSENTAVETKSFEIITADTLVIDKAIYYAGEDKLWVKIYSNAAPLGSAGITAKIIINGNETVLGAVPWRADKSAYQNAFQGITDKPDSVSLVSDQGGEITGSVEQNSDALVIHNANYYPDNSIWIQASSDAEPLGAADIQAFTVINGVETLLGTIGWKADKGFYQQSFQNISNMPQEIIVRSDFGGEQVATVTQVPDDIDITTVLYFESENRIWVRAQSFHNEVALSTSVLTAYKVENGVESVLGPVTWKSNVDFYQTNFTSINTIPDSIILRSSIGGEATITSSGIELR